MLGAIPYIDPEAYKRWGPQNKKYFGEEILVDHTLTPQHVIQTKEIEFPEQIVLRSISYEKWKIFKLFYNDPDIIPKIVEACIVRIVPDNFKLLKLIYQRPMFWKSLFLIIQTISKFNFEIKDEEEKLANQVEAAQKRYASTLDGIYEAFVFISFPTMYEYFQKLDFYARVDFIGLIQYLTGVDVHHNLTLFRTGKVKTLKLTPMDQKDMPKDLLEKKGIAKEVVTESQEKLREQILRDRKFKVKKTISTEFENTEFAQAET